MIWTLTNQGLVFKFCRSLTLVTWHFIYEITTLKDWHSYIAFEIFNSPRIFHKCREMHKDMILLQKKYSPMHNAQCGCKGYLPLSPKRFLSCWMMNGTTIFEVTALIFFICLSIVENNYFSIFLKYSEHIHILRVVWFSLLIIWMEK